MKFIFALMTYTSINTDDMLAIERIHRKNIINYQINSSLIFTASIDVANRNVKSHPKMIIASGLNERKY